MSGRKRRLEQDGQGIAAIRLNLPYGCPTRRKLAMCLRFIPAAISVRIPRKTNLTTSCIRDSHITCLLTRVA